MATSKVLYVIFFFSFLLIPVEKDRKKRMTELENRQLRNQNDSFYFIGLKRLQNECNRDKDSRFEIVKIYNRYSNY